MAANADVVVVGDGVLGGVPADVAERSRRLAGLAGDPVLGIRLGSDLDGGWTFIGADPAPTCGSPVRPGSTDWPTCSDSSRCRIRSEPPLALVAAEAHRLAVETRAVRPASGARDLARTRGRRRRRHLAGRSGRPPAARRGPRRLCSGHGRPAPARGRAPAAARAQRGPCPGAARQAGGLDRDRARPRRQSCARPGEQRGQADQLQLIAAAGFAVPDTLITSDPEAVIEFRASGTGHWSTSR